MLTKDIILSILPSQTNRVFIAYSGGVDSHVLLQLASTIESVRSKVVAVYVNHGLQEEASDWALHCEKIAQVLDIEFHCVDVNIEKQARESLEEAARNARYVVFKTFLDKDDVILLAQHREDQMETVLLQLFRGAGVRGLSGMPLSVSFGKGTMLRPFLDVSKADIMAYAESHQLQWVEDPSNQQNDFDRNFLRNQIVPQLKQRWPAIDKTVSRSARHCANSERLSQHVANQLLNEVCDRSDQTLMIDRLLDLDVNQQYLVIRQWFGSMKMRMPSEGRVETILNEIVLARENANPVLNGKGYLIRRYRNKLYCLNSISNRLKIPDRYWAKDKKIFNVQFEFRLILVDSLGGLSKQLWDRSEVYVKPRVGSEKIRVLGRNGHHSLKKLFQEEGVPPWERDGVPLIYLDDQLAAIAGLWLSADCCVGKDEVGYQIVFKRCNNIK